MYTELNKSYEEQNKLMQFFVDFIIFMEKHKAK